jgi:hypothetical protein
MLHGSTLLTRDLEVCAVPELAKVEKLRSVRRDLRPAHRLTPQRLSLPRQPVSWHSERVNADPGGTRLRSATSGYASFEAILGDIRIACETAEEPDGVIFEPMGLA